ncbi:MAG: twin-arginine translocase subunit TatC, partial [candidate division NC10 bacterium]|nr:twin-arginine translocase subunit TatC [candidate division NC10 bacterium]
MPDDAKMPFLAHLGELRKRLIVCFSVIGIAFILTFNFRTIFLQLLQRPLTTDVTMGRQFPFIG